MKRIIHICLWLLTGIFAEVSLSAQNPFIYHKGKTYKDVAAYRMEEIIDLNTHTPSTPFYTNNKCRNTKALFRIRLHFLCMSSLYGR